MSASYSCVGCTGPLMPGKRFLAYPSLPVRNSFEASGEKRSRVGARMPETHATREAAVNMPASDATNNEHRETKNNGRI